jgi:two-component system, LytTR family, response regulator
MTNELKVLIVDDESLARRIIRRQLKAERRVQTIVEAQNGDEALEMIGRFAPDIIYLDIQMPGCNGFELLEKLRQFAPSKMPVIIFVTAFDEYALKAFEFHALDYLLKPFDQNRFRQSFELAVKQISAENQNTYQSKLIRLIDDLKSPNEHLEWVSVKKDDTISLFKIDEIRWIEAQGNYVMLNFSETKHLLREKMDALEAKLDAAKFIRIHRSAIVNISYISEIEVWGRGEHKIVMTGGKTFGISRHYRSNFDDFFSKRVL